MPATLTARIGLFLALAALMALTRFNHFGALPDASWAVFLAAGFYLRAQWRWAFPALMGLAVLVDYVVISRAGLNFFAHYCVSPGYWFLLPAHASLWLGGAWFGTQTTQPATTRVLQLVAVTVVAVVICHAFAQGGFYWFSDSVAAPGAAGWLKNYSDWLPAYLGTTGIYVGVMAVMHVLATGLFGLGTDPRHDEAR